MRKKILIVDDFEDARALMTTLLTSYGFDVIQASNGYEAVEMAVGEHPDLIFMDIAMPVMDGVQATTAIREHHELDDVPIIALTAYGEFYNLRAKDVGCNDVIQKPLDYENLRPLVQQYIH